MGANEGAATTQEGTALLTRMTLDLFESIEKKLIHNLGGHFYPIYHVIT